jgi:hypothetical protein
MLNTELGISIVRDKICWKLAVERKLVISEQPDDGLDAQSPYLR